MNEQCSSPSPDTASELAFQALSQSGCGALVSDNEGKIIYVNPRLCEISGYAREELIGQNPRMLQSGHTPRETYLALWNTVSSGRPWHGVLQNRKKTGEYYWEAITISPLRAQSGEITHFSAILEDVTVEKIAEASQTELEEEIFQEEKRESLAAMAIGMSHDLNNSLSCILAACDLATRVQGDPNALKEMLGHVESAAQRSAAFVEQMVSLWRPSMSTSLTIDLAKIVSQHLSHYQRTSGLASLRWLPQAGFTPTIGCPALIHEAVLALLENARESWPHDAIELSCGTISRLEPDDDEHFIPCGLTGLSVVYLEVKDSGCGMDSYTVRRAFNPFFTTKRGQKGLGLSTVYGLMTGHKGAIGVKSEQEKGTRIRLYFRTAAPATASPT